MGILVNKKKNIRRFTEDVLSKEMKASIREMAKNIAQEVTRKMISAQKKIN